ncbi:hypothetical protein I8J29_28490 [Paenibacillus sp. MWE-103]|uniref:Amino acid transporter n=1 Tax=Paenibacillus artemisiicola TaxID=1172618 RepID=A0ABS3WIL1_9BACL|nr:hypothetical protein [Paenibacillus artemisiicola]MBO7748137.1 hypothetical protein [Paenibacillus artemisiicola]
MPEEPDQRERREETIAQTKPGGSFNDVTEHYRTVMGVPDKPVDLNGMPKPLRMFGYFFLGAFALFAIVLVVTVIVQSWG